MSNHLLPLPIDSFFAAKERTDIETALACFSEGAIVLDNGEDLTLEGIGCIRDWMTRTLSEYKLSSEVVSVQEQGVTYLVGVVVSGEFPGSPYKFEYRFEVQDDKISKLTIDPIGSLAD